MDDNVLQQIDQLAKELRGSSEDKSVESLVLLIQHPAWELFRNIKGINPETTIVLLSNIKFSEVKYVSQIYNCCGISKSSNSKRQNFLKKSLNKQADQFIKDDSEYALYYWVKISKVLTIDRFTGNKHEWKHIERIARRYMLQKYLRDVCLYFKDVSGNEIGNGVQERGIFTSDNLTNWKQFICTDEKKITFMHYSYKVSIDIKKSIIDILKKEMKITDYENGDSM